MYGGRCTPYVGLEWAACEAQVYTVLVYLEDSLLLVFTDMFVGGHHAAASTFPAVAAMLLRYHMDQLAPTHSTTTLVTMLGRLVPLLLLL